MTWLGKLLVLANMLLSVVLLGVAAGLLFNRVDWSNNSAAKDQPAGELRKRLDRIKELGAPYQVAQQRFRAARARLQVAEVRRSESQRWHADTLAVADAGRGGKADVPIAALVMQNGRTVPDPRDANRVRMEEAKDRAGGGLLARKHYRDRLEEVHKDILKEQSDLQAITERAKKLTREMVGPDPGMDGPKGLYDEIKDEKDKLATVEQEIKSLRFRNTVAAVELDALTRRLEHLRQRVAELKAPAGTAARP